jgi:putative Mg2+ transporter-C (MgtC) family protein
MAVTLQDISLDILLSGPPLQLCIATLLGAAIGLEREVAGKDPSLRTFALISVGSCMFALISSESAHSLIREFPDKTADPSRIAAQVVSGIGFIGAGTIFRSKTGVSGLTTAALMWVTASIGLACGFARLDLALVGTLLALCVTVLFRPIHALLDIIKKGKGPKRLDDNSQTFE